nr:MAG: polyprotein P2a [Sobemovirus sp.]
MAPLSAEQIALLVAALLYALVAAHQWITFPQDATAPAMTIIALLLVLLVIAPYLWRSLRTRLVRVRTVPELPTEPPAGLVGKPYFDPKWGVMGTCLKANGESFPILINVEWWNLLPSPAISRDGGQEAAIIGKTFSEVVPGKEPASLVTIYGPNDDVVGMGSRVSWNGGTWLLTASHVWIPDVDMALAKGNNMVTVKPNQCKGAVRCADTRVDFTLVPIPDPVWSVLKVKSIPLAPMNKNVPCVLYGGRHPTSLMSSAGIATKGEYGFQIEHNAPTTNGWSGTPIYSQGCVVGIHTGSKVLGEVNRGVNAGLLLSISKETVYSEVSYNEIPYGPEVEGNGYFRATIEGMGDYYLGPSGYSVAQELKKQEASFKNPAWSSMLDDDFYDSLESTDEHLNLQRAAMRKRVPHCLNLDGTKSSPQENPSQLQACPSVMWEHRVATLEKTLESLTVQLSKLLQESSLSLRPTGGLGEALKQSSNRSSSSQAASAPRNPPKNLGKLVENSKLVTPKADPEGASEGKSGATAKSRRRSRRSRGKKSTAAPPQGSRYRSLGQQMGKSSTAT